MWEKSLISTILYGSLTLIFWYFSVPNIWVPATALVLSLVYFPFHGWVSSDRLGANATLSVLVKFAISIVGLIGLIAGFTSLALLVMWAIS